MGSGYVEKRAHKEESRTGWGRVIATTVLGPLLVATIPVAGYGIISWGYDLRALDLNFRNLEGDLTRIVEWQGSHDDVHDAFDTRYAQARNQEAVAQYQIKGCEEDINRVEEVVRLLRDTLHQLQEEDASAGR